ncbi:unnamed protein product [Bursaphelenchus xylophilus]|nr:unnamed protein product [Bursaphelenchus xylophilus]CAG9098103.1 unnamed protein product [Bursaphelenchus xylophilus]
METIEVSIASLKAVLDVFKFQTIHFRSLTNIAKKQSKLIEDMKMEKQKLMKRINTLESENEKMVDLGPFVETLKEVTKISQFQAIHVKSLAKTSSRRENIIKKLSSQVEEKVKANNSLLKVCAVSREVETLKISSQFHKGELEKSQNKCTDLERKIDKLKREIHNQAMMSGSLNPYQTSFIPGLDTSVSHNEVSFCLAEQKPPGNPRQSTDFHLNGTSSNVSSVPDQSNDSFSFQLPFFQNSRINRSDSREDRRMGPPNHPPRRRSVQGNMEERSFVITPQERNTSTSSLRVKMPMTPDDGAEPTILASFDSSGRRRTPTKCSTPLMPGEVTSRRILSPFISALDS